MKTIAIPNIEYDILVKIANSRRWTYLVTITDMINYYDRADSADSEIISDQEPD